MIKRILVPLDNSEYSDYALEYACFFAKQQQAQVTGLVVLDTPGISHNIGMVPPGSFHYAKLLEKHIEDTEREHIHTLLAKFKKKCEKEGVEHEESEYQGSPAHIIIAEAGYYDLIITGIRTFFSFGSHDGEGDSVEKLLDHSPTPILAIPKKSPQLSGEKIKTVIAFNCSHSSCKAINRFVHMMLPETTDITLFNSSDDHQEGYHCLNKAEKYLKSFGFRQIKKEHSTTNIISAFEGTLGQADLVVVGAHSRNVIINFMLGSLTSHLITKAQNAVFIGM